jgi:hypothetical protein
LINAGDEGEEVRPAVVWNGGFAGLFPKKAVVMARQCKKNRIRAKKNVIMAAM